MMPGDKPFLFHVIGDVREFWIVIGDSRYAILVMLVNLGW